MEDKRTPPRLMASLKVRSPATTLEGFAEERARDILVEGMFVESRAPHEVDTVLKVLVELEGGEVVISGMGRVAWRLTPVQAGPHGTPGMGIEFTQLDKTSQDHLEQIVQQRPEAGTRFAQQAEAARQDAERALERAAEAERAEAEAEAPPPSARTSATQDSPISLAAEFMARDAPAPVPRKEPVRTAPEPAPAPQRRTVPLAIASAVAVLCLGAAAYTVVPLLLAPDETAVGEALALHRKATDARVPGADRAKNQAAYDAYVANLSSRTKAEVVLRAQQEFEATREQGLQQFFRLSPERQAKFLETFEARRGKALKEEGAWFRPFGETSPQQTPEQRQLDERFAAMLKARPPTPAP